MEYAERSELIDSYRIVHGGSTPPNSQIAKSAYGLIHAVGWDASFLRRCLENCRMMRCLSPHSMISSFVLRKRCSAVRALIYLETRHIVAQRPSSESC